jgi:hypothetical protein
MVNAQAQPTQGAPEIASVLLGIQGGLFLVAGLGALPFGIVEPWMRLLGLATLLLAGSTFWLARGVRRHRRWARRWTVGLETFCVVGTLLLSMATCQFPERPGAGAHQPGAARRDRWSPAAGLTPRRLVS